jgi:hemerythrin-like domain-containing protein
MKDLVQVLKQQHLQGRLLTDCILSHANDDHLHNPKHLNTLKQALQQFIAMYRPHAAREDTILFPAFKTLVSEKTYQALGDAFEDKEESLFGKGGFGHIVE